MKGGETKMAIKVEIRKPKVGMTKDNKGHTYIHFGGDLKRRFQVLAEKCGYSRKLNEFGVELFVQALAEAESDFASKNPDSE
jgi:hypothetical protein